MNRRLMKRLAIWIAVISVVSGCLTGCKKEENNSPKEGWETAVEKGDMEIQQALSGNGGNEKWRDESFTLEHEEYSVITEEEDEEESSVTEKAEDAASEEMSEEASRDNSVETSAETSSEDPAEQEEADALEQEQTATPSFINPLSGETMGEDVSHFRPFVFAFNDHFVALPQKGISQSDLIVEYLIECNVTRYTAFFMPWKMQGVIGSIQGTRAVTAEIALGYDGILVHCGEDRETQILLNAHPLDDLNETSDNTQRGAMFRNMEIQSIGTEHTLFGNGEKLVEVASRDGYRDSHEASFDTTYGLIFSNDAADQCKESAKEVHVTFAGGKTSDFTYDANLNGYTLTQYGKVLTDSEEDEAEIVFANVINIYAPSHIQADGVYVSTDLSQGGEGTFFTEGKAVAIRWTKDGAEDVFHFTLEDGTPLKFSVGRTYICINQDGSNRYQGNCSWE